MDIAQALTKLSPYADFLGDLELKELIDLSHEISVDAGELFHKTGQPVEHAYIVLEGKVATTFTREWNEECVLEQMGIGDTLCESELLNEDNCQNDIRALEDTRLLCVPRQDYMRLVTSNPRLLQYLTQQAQSRTSYSLITRLLNNLFGTSKLNFTDPLLKLEAEVEWLNFEQEFLQQCKKEAKWLILKRGEYLFHQGDKQDGVYVLATGVLGVSIKQENGEEREIARLHHGEIVGELALVNNDTRSASIVALRDCELFRLSSNEFKHIGEKYPRVVQNVYRTISERFKQRTSSNIYRPKKSNIALITLTQDDALHSFSDEIFEAISKVDSAEYLTSQAVDNHLERTGAANCDRSDPGAIGLMQWLNGRETRSEFVVYRADDGWTEWTMRCISQSDRVMVLADVNSKPEFTVFKQHLSDSGQSWSLVLLHPENTDRPRDTTQWRTTSGASEIYHVRKNNTGDIERLARILTGSATGLVLGGGGARGFAHLGVLRAFDELGIKIDMIGGTSIGSPIAAWVAQNKSAEECLTRATRAFSSLIDFTLPFTSMISGKRISRTISEQAADWDIEDFWLPFFCVSTNLTTAKQIIHRNGNAASAVRSSVSRPGVLPPAPDNGDLLVDGGVLTNLPIDIMREMNPSGTVIAFDVAPPRGPTAKEDYGMSMSGWQQLVRMIVPWLKPIRAPRIGVVIMQSMVIGSSLARERSLNQKMADYYQNIHVKNVGMLDFKAINKAEKTGYESVIQPLRSWLEQQVKSQDKTQH